MLKKVLAMKPTAKDRIPTRSFNFTMQNLNSRIKVDGAKQTYVSYLNSNDSYKESKNKQ